MPTNTTDPPVERKALTIREVCQSTHLSRETIDQAIRDRTLRVIKVGRAIRILPSDVDAWLESLRPDARP